MPRTSTNMRLVPLKEEPPKLSYQGVLDNALAGISEGVQALRDIISDPETENKDRIGAVNAMVQAFLKISEARVAENLPLLQQLEKSVNSK